MNAIGVPTRFRPRISAVVSLAAHTVLLVLLAFTSITIVSEDRRMIPLVIRDSAPPPPPPGGGAGGGPPVASASIAAPVVPLASVDHPKPEKAPQPAERLKIAVRPRPKQDAARQQPTPVASQPQAEDTAMASAEPTGDAGPGVAGGVIGGVAGGQVGGKLGGRIGGTGDEVGGPSQVPLKVLYAVRPKYPSVARSRQQEGLVIVQAVIDGHGLVKSDSVQVIKSQPPFDEPAVSAFRQWKFDPGSAGGGQVVTVPIRFSLHD
jgi:protein TonB